MIFILKCCVYHFILQVAFRLDFAKCRHHLCVLPKYTPSTSIHRFPVADRLQGILPVFLVSMYKNSHAQAGYPITNNQLPDVLLMTYLKKSASLPVCHVNKPVTWQEWMDHGGLFGVKSEEIGAVYATFLPSFRFQIFSKAWLIYMFWQF